MFCKNFILAKFILILFLFFLKESISIASSITERQISSWAIDLKTQESSIESQDLSIGKIVYKPKVALIDTGIDFKNPYLEGAFIYTPEKNRILGNDFSGDKNKKNDLLDKHGHGTHLAGIMKAVFPEITIIPLKYYSQNDSSGNNLKGTIEALKFAINQKVDIINYSGGGSLPSPKEQKILTKAAELGILIIVAAGNDGENLDNGKAHYYPASYNLPQMITVTAHSENGLPISSANYGAKTVHISAPGEKILSILPQNKFGRMTGTSQATAFTSAVAAMIKSRFPELSAIEIKEIILQSADKKAYLKGKILSEGILKASKAFQLAKEYSSAKKIVAKSTNESNKTNS